MQIMQDIIYEVFETDADLLEGRLIHRGFSRDIAESKMAKEFLLEYGQVDYMLKNRYTQEVLELLLSDHTKALRGETR
jgi:hypothetical protein